jgi:hypothetical protein
MTHDSHPAPPQASYPPPMPIRALRQGVNVPARQALALTGAGLIALSVPVGFATPNIPVGLPMAVVGVVLLSRNAVWGQRWLDDLLVRRPGVERLVPAWLVKALLQREKRSLSR